jgi:protein TonB
LDTGSANKPCGSSIPKLDMAHPRLEVSSIRNRYATHLQVGLALSLVLILAATHLSLPFNKEADPAVRKQKAVDLRHVQSTGQAPAPPPPSTPMVPRVVPREEIVESPSVEFNSSLTLDATSDQGSGAAVRPDCGGLQSLREKTYYPTSALTEGLEGRVLVEFIVGEDGDIESPEVVDGVSKILNQAALRAVRRLKCTPGRKRSRPVEAELTKTVVFALPEKMDAS